MRYVITLDTDTQLPRDSAAQFVATMAHPLNRPRLGGAAEAPRVVGGYGILQPRVERQPARRRTARATHASSAASAGIDPYTRAVSDVYQDLFGEGSFIGKGIYDVDAFEHVLGGRLPDNRILSHDLLEGCYARSGLISDVATGRGIALALRRRREAPPPLDARRLADHRLADAAREGPGRRRRGRRGEAHPRRQAEESAVDAVAMEDRRQPAAQPGAALR